MTGPPSREPYLRLLWVDPESGCRGYAVIDRLIDGLAGGGIRMRPGVTLVEVERLALAMSHKKALAGAMGGGAKGGIDFDPQDARADDVLRRYVAAMSPLFGTCWSAAGDLGVSEQRLAGIFRDLGLGLTVQALANRIADQEAAAGVIAAALEVSVDGIALGECAAGYGVAQAAAAALAHDGREVRGASAVVQGFGSIGGTAARYLAELGVHVVGIADARGLIVDGGGLNVEAMLRSRDRNGEVDRAALPSTCQERPRDDWLAMDVDILVPAAIADAIDIGDCEHVTARLIVEAANLPMTSLAQARLHDRGIRIVPDVVANAGTTAWFTWLARGEITPDAASTFSRVRTLMNETVPAVLRLADEQAITTHQAAAELAERRLAATSSPERSGRGYSPLATASIHAAARRSGDAEVHGCS